MNVIKYEDIRPDPRFSALHPFAATLLASLELSADQVQQLLQPIEQICTDSAVDAVVSWFKQRQLQHDKIMICGDYDCDGILSTSLLVLLCDQLELNCGYYIPNRIKEGYGVSPATIQAAFDKGYRHVICVDNGVSAQAARETALRLGMDMVIIDHHIILQDQTGVLLLHPDVLSPYFAGLCASGLVLLVCEHFVLTPLMSALAAVATIGDMMNLWGKNRELVRTGLRVLNTTRIAAVDALASKDTLYTSTVLAFQIVPKINAIGRLADQFNVNTLVQYFTRTASDQIPAVAAQIIGVNQQRQQISREMMALASQDIQADAVTIIAHRDFHEGLVGIVAGQLVAQTGKPTFVFRENESTFKGSGRSQTISLMDLLASVDPALIAHMGGHHQAAGLEVKRENFLEFTRQVQLLAPTLPLLTKPEEIVIALDPDQISLPAMIELEQFEPFGQGFTLPAIAVDLTKPGQPLKQNTLKWVYPTLDILYFRAPQAYIDHGVAIGHLSIQRFRGQAKVQMILDEVVQND